jgi:hypothetical protein
MGEMMTREQALELKNSILWSGVQEELDKWLSNEVFRLKHCTKEELEIIQARIQELEKVKNLPDIVSDREE